MLCRLSSGLVLLSRGLNSQSGFLIKTPHRRSFVASHGSLYCKSKGLCVGLEYLVEQCLCGEVKQV